MARQNRTPIEIIKKELVKLLWGIVVAAVGLLILWFVARPILQNLFQNLGRDISATSSQLTNDHKVAK